jgi:hypothetical protein
MAHVAADVVTTRALNRALLARQLLLDRADLPVLGAVHHLVGLQAQLPLNPYVGLWSRLAGFRADELAGLLVDRRVVRLVLMRATIHLVTAEDCLAIRPLVQPVLDAELARHAELGPHLVGVDLEPVLAFARPLLAERPRTGAELRAAMAERFPDLHPGALAYACRNRLAAVQVPPRGVWGRTGQVALTTAEAWLGRPLAERPSIDDVVLRYLAAFGPAAPADVAAWSRLTGMRAVLDRLRPRLRPFRDERGRELLDLPDAPRPDPATPAPPRFLPEFDNVVLSHADRTRVMADDDRRRLFGPGLPVRGLVLVDGFARASWAVEGDALVVRSAGPLTGDERDDVAAEGARLLAFLGAAATDVRFEPAG